MPKSYHRNADEMLFKTDNVCQLKSQKKIKLKKERKKLACNMNENKNRRKAIFNWAAKWPFFLRGGGGYTHSG